MFGGSAFGMEVFSGVLIEESEAIPLFALGSDIDCIDTATTGTDLLPASDGYCD